MIKVRYLKMIITFYYFKKWSAHFYISFHFSKWQYARAGKLISIFELENWNPFFNFWFPKLKLKKLQNKFVDIILFWFYNEVTKLKKGLQIMRKFSRKEKKILFYLPILLFLFNNTIISLLVVTFYGWAFLIWLFKNMPTN